MGQDYYLCDCNTWAVIWRRGKASVATRWGVAMASTLEGASTDYLLFMKWPPALFGGRMITDHSLFGDLETTDPPPVRERGKYCHHYIPLYNLELTSAWPSSAESRCYMETCLWNIELSQCFTLPNDHKVKLTYCHVKNVSLIPQLRQ